MEIRKSQHFNKYTNLTIVLLVASCLLITGCSDGKEPSHPSSEFIYSPSKDAININTASATELKKIPHVGEKIALRIIEHRETYGPFRKAEHLILIPGISDSRFRKMRGLVRVD